MEEVIYKNDLKEILVTTTTLTCQQVLKLGGDAFTLYMFYVYTSSWQGNNRPKATDTFCMKGLRWGKEKFYRTKKKLEDGEYIEKYTDRDELGKVIGHYVLIKYLIQSPQNQRVANPEGGFQETNTYKEREIPINKINTSKVALGEFKKVLLTEDEYQKLIERMGEHNTAILIAELDAYIASKGKQYSSHYATILNWARRKMVDHKKNQSNLAF